MKTKLVFLLAVVLIAGMIFSSCAPAAPAASSAAPAASSAAPAASSTAPVASSAAASSAAPSVAASESAAASAAAFIPSKPQIQPPQQTIDILDVMAKIDAEKAANNYPQHPWTFAIHSYDPGYENSAIYANAIRDECKKYGIKTTEAFCEKDVSKYPANYQTFITQKVDLILDVGWLGNKNVIDIAMDAGIPVVTYDVPFDDTRSWTVGGDPAVGGTAIGKHMVGVVNDKWGGKIDSVCVAWSQSLGEPMRIRMQSAIDAMKAGGINIPDNIVSWYNNDGETLKSKNIVADFLTAHPNDHHILLAANTGNVGAGMLAAVETAGRENDVMIYSYGAEQVALDNLKGPANCWVGDVSFFTNQYGWLGVNTAIRVMNGEKVGKWVTPQAFVITHDNIKDYRG